MSRRQQIAFGAVLFLIGGGLLARQFVPALEPLMGWPLMLIPLGLLGIVGAAILQRGEWLIVCALLTGIGFNLWAASHLNDSVWVSMIAFLGFGLLLASLFDPTEKHSWRQGLTLIALSAGLFLLIGGKLFLPFPRLNSYSPALVALIGAVLILTGLFRKKKQP